jgi:hypothetical protein
MRLNVSFGPFLVLPLNASTPVLRHGSTLILQPFAYSSISFPMLENLEWVLLTDLGTQHFRNDFFATSLAKSRFFSFWKAAVFLPYFFVVLDFPHSLLLLLLLLLTIIIIINNYYY